MFAVVKIGSEQFKVAEGDVIETRVLEQELDKEIALDVLVYENGTDVRFGQPFVKNVKVTAKVKGQAQGEKTVAFKYRLRKNSKRTHGHRQDLTVLNITKIQAN